MGEYYRRLPFKERHVDLFRRFFLALAEAKGPALIHCAAGKDRTGVLAALTHHIAGVSDDDVIDDYLLTNDPSRFERRGAAFMDHIQEVTGRRPSEAAMRAAMGVEARIWRRVRGDQGRARIAGRVSGARSSGWMRRRGSACGRIFWRRASRENPSLHERGISGDKRSFKVQPSLTAPIEGRQHWVWHE
jgi:hypothetical protein